MCNTHFSTYAFCSHSTKTLTLCPLEQLTDCKKTQTGTLYHSLCHDCINARLEEEERRSRLSSPIRSGSSSKSLRRSASKLERGLNWLKRKKSVVMSPEGHTYFEGSFTPIASQNPVPGVGRATTLPIARHEAPVPMVAKSISAPVGAAAIAAAGEFSRARVTSSGSNMASDAAGPRARAVSSGSEKLAEEYQKLIGSITPSVSPKSNDDSENACVQGQIPFEQTRELEQETGRISRAKHPNQRENICFQLPSVPRTQQPILYQDQRAERDIEVVERMASPGDKAKVNFQQLPPVSRTQQQVAKKAEKDVDRMSMMTTFSTFIPQPISGNVESRREGSTLKDGTFDHRRLVQERPQRYLRKERGQRQHFELPRKDPEQGVRFEHMEQRDERQVQLPDIQEHAELCRSPERMIKKPRPVMQWPGMEQLQQELPSNPAREQEHTEQRSQYSLQQGQAHSKQRINVQRKKREPRPFTQWPDTEPNQYEEPYPNILTEKEDPSYSSQPLLEQKHSQDYYEQSVDFRPEGRNSADPSERFPSSKSSPQDERFQRQENPLIRGHELAQERIAKLKREERFREELRKADERLSQVRDGRGHIDYSHNRIS